MTGKKNDDMAGSISEPASGAPEIRPAKSLWPRPYGDVRVEPNLEPPTDDIPIVEPPVSVPEGEFDPVVPEDYQEPVVEQAAEDEAAPEPEPESAVGQPEPEAEALDEPEAEAPEANGEPDTGFDAESEPEPDSGAEPVPEPIIPRIVAVGELQSEPDPEPVVKPDPDPIRVREDERAAAVFDAADEQEPALKDPAESRAGRFIAMAAGIVVALALGAVALVYGASGLGFTFGKSGETTAAAPPPAPTPAPTPVAVVDPDELKAAQERVQELEARLKALEEEKAAAEQQAQPEPAAQPEPQPAEQTAAIAPAEPVAEPQSEPPPPAASEPAPAPSAETPAAEAPQPASRPPAIPTPRPAETARAEPVPPPPPSYDTRPSYNAPRDRGSPEMPVLQDWAVRDVYNGIAVIQGGRGAPLEVEPGDELPGGNRVLAIRRLGGNWAVVTERGIIAGY